MKFFFLSLFLMFSIYLHAQDDKSFSVSIIGGTHGFGIRADMKTELKLLKTAQTSFYLDFTLRNKNFEQSTLNFSRVNYNSAVRIFDVGLGIAQEFEIAKNFFVIPYLGGRFEYARFQDGDLVDAIGTDNIVRYTDQTYTKQVGPVIKNGYGDVITIDIGSRLSYHITPSIEINALIGLAPVSYSTPNTLFGKYRGESPYSNPYYIDTALLRFEGALKFNF